MIIRPDVKINKDIPHETWNTCPNCNRDWKDAAPTQGLLHRTKLCYWCMTELEPYPFHVVRN